MCKGILCEKCNSSICSKNFEKWTTLYSDQELNKYKMEIKNFVKILGIQWLQIFIISITILLCTT